jgi:hypothetical protein
MELIALLFIGYAASYGFQIRFDFGLWLVCLDIGIEQGFKGFL